MDGYVRVSRRMGREGPGYISPTIQRDAIERWAKYRDVEIIMWHEDEDHSGGTQQRPGIREAIRRIEAGETEGIACWRLNRFARNVSAAIEDVKRIEAAGGYLAFVEEDIDPTGPFGSFLLTVLLAVSTLERDNISSGWLNAKSRAVARGVKIGPAPLGYEKRDGGVLHPSPDAPIIKEAFRLAASGGISAAKDYLEDRQPERAWTSSTTRRLLGSRTYLGEITYGDLINTEAHEALVTRSEWEAAQRPSEKRRYKTTESYLLSGVVVCAGCGRPMVGSKSNDVRVYRCKYNHYVRPNEKEPCEAPAVISAERLEPFVIDALRRAWLEEGFRQVAPEEGAEAAQTALEEAEAELYAFAADTTLRKALGPRYQELLETRSQAVEDAQREFRERSQNAAKGPLVMSSEILDSASPDELRELVGLAFKRIEVTKGRGSVDARTKLVLYGAPDPAVPGPKDS